MAHEEQGKPVRVWSESSVTIPVGDSNPYAFVKASVGHERYAPSDSLQDIRKTTKLIEEYNEAEVDRLIKKFSRLVEQVGHMDDPEPAPRRRKRRAQ